MSWQSEHGPSYEVPGLITFMVKEGILKDDSWHNDTMPRFQVEDPKNEDRGVTLWVDHPIGSQRETGPEGKRFMVQDGDLAGESDFELETDDLEEALTTLLSKAEQYLPKNRRPHFDGLVREWIKTMH